jgi:hypothetical protein
MILIYIVLAFFAGLRIVQLLQVDVGPLAIFENFRSLLEELEYQTGKMTRFHFPYTLVYNFNQGFNCQLCLSVWVYGLLAFGFWLTGVALFNSLLIWLGLSGIYYLLVKG